MTRSLSVVIPVCNAEKTLAANVHHILDVLADLTERFELVLVDEGSTDHTVEVARELSAEFPQLRVTKRCSATDGEANDEPALAGTLGEWVFIHRSHASFSPNEIRRAWELCGDTAEQGHIRLLAGEGGE